LGFVASLIPAVFEMPVYSSCTPPAVTAALIVLSEDPMGAVNWKYVYVSSAQHSVDTATSVVTGAALLQIESLSEVTKDVATRVENSPSVLA
jgi:hypothetical protein